MKLDSFETVMYERIKKLKEQEQFLPDHERDPALRIDEAFLAMVTQARPSGQYFESNIGEKMLFLERMDRLRYDIMDQHMRKKSEHLQADLKKVR